MLNSICLDRMRYVAAYLLAVLGGNDKPSAAEIKKILSSVGIDADDAAIKKVTSELGGKNINELIEAGKFYIEVYLESLKCYKCWKR